MLIDKSDIEKAKQKLGDRNATLIAELLELEKFDERNLKACCPYHSENTPSFIYNKKGYYYKCFSCGQTVDLIDVLTQKGYTFLNACKYLFEQADIPYSFGEQSVKTKSNYRYPHEDGVKNGEKVVEYLGKRGISKNVIDYLDIREDSNGNCVFNFYDNNDVLTMVKYRPSHPVQKPNPKTWCQKNADTSPLLFNMNRVNTSKPLLITEGECFKGDVEVLTPNGWIRLDEYTNQMVMQVNSDLSGEFVEPYARIVKEYKGDLYTLKRGGNFELTTTAKHNWVYKKASGELIKRKICEFPSSLGDKTIPTTISVNKYHIDLSNDEIALWLAVSADGTIDIRHNDAYNYCRIAFTKQRKIERLIEILERLNISYIKTTQKARPDYTFFGFRIPKYFTKELPIGFATMTSLEQKKFILEEMVHWDGNHVSNRNQFEYSSKLYWNATVMQTIAHTCGYMSTIMHRTNKYGEWYKVSILFGKDSVSYQTGISSIDKYEGLVYCVSVPSGMILVRQNGHISVCGNCDSASCIEAGYLNTVSIPLGCQNTHWIEENFDWLEQFDSIILWFDNDEPGIKARKECINRLGTWRTKYIENPKFILKNGKNIPVKDANECLQIGGKEFVIDLINNAKDVPVKSVVNFSEVEDTDTSEWEGITTGIKPFDDAMDKLYYGTLTICTGRPGSGKTSIMDQMIGHTMDEGNSVFLYSKELPEAMTANWMHSILAGRRNISKKTTKDGREYYVVPYDIKKQIKDYYDANLYIYRDEETNEVDKLLHSMEESVRKFGCKFIVLDNLMMIDLDCTETEQNNAQKAFINKLIKFAVKFNVAILLCAHPRKTPDNSSEVGMYDIAGSSTIINLAMRSFGMRRISKKEKEDPKAKFGNYDVELNIIKDRIFGRSDVSMGLWYDNPSRRFYTNYDEFDYQFKWDKKRYVDKLPYVDRSKQEVNNPFD